MGESLEKRFIETINKPCFIYSNSVLLKKKILLDKLKFLISSKKISKYEIFIVNCKDKTFFTYLEPLLLEFAQGVSNFDKNYNFINSFFSRTFFLENLDSFGLSSVDFKNKEVGVVDALFDSISTIRRKGYCLKEFERVEFSDINSKVDIFNAWVKFEQFKKKNRLYDEIDCLEMFRILLKKNSEFLKEVRGRFKYFIFDNVECLSDLELDIFKIIFDSEIHSVSISYLEAYFENESILSLKEYFSEFEEFEIENRSDLNLKKTLVQCSSEISERTFVLEKINEVSNEFRSIGVIVPNEKEKKELINFLDSYGLTIKNDYISNIFDNELLVYLRDILRVLFSPKNSNLEMISILQNHSLCEETIRRISRLSSRCEKSIYKVLVEREGLSDFDSEKKILDNLKTTFMNLFEMRDSSIGLLNLVMNVISGFKFYERAISTNKHFNVSILNQFIGFLKDFISVYNSQSLEDFLKVIDLAEKLRFEFNGFKNERGVEVLLKSEVIGREFDLLLVCGLNEGNLPSTFRYNIFNHPFLLSRDDHMTFEKMSFDSLFFLSQNEIFLLYVKRLSHRSIDSKPSRFLLGIDINLIKYSKELPLFCIGILDEVKLEIISKMRDLILLNDFDSAVLEIGLLKNLFGKKDLTSFIVDEHPNHSKYISMLEHSKRNSFGDVDTSNLVFSVSQLQTYELCPKKYLYSYIYKIPSEPKHYFDFGTSIHSVLEELVLEFDSGLSLEELYLKGVELMTKCWVSKGYETAELEKEYFEKGLIIIREFVKRENDLRDGSREIVSQERKFFLEIDGRRMMGIIDRIDKVDNKFEIIDYKTSKSMETEQGLKENMQLFVYSMALKAEKEFGEYPSRVGLWYVLHDRILSVEPAMKNLEKVKERILRLMKGIENKEFNATPSDFGCRFCDFSKICDDSKKC